MNLRPFAYSYFDHPYAVAGNPHGLLRQDGSYAYPDRGAYNLHGEFYAFPLCLAEDYLICCRADFEKGHAGFVVYAAPLRDSFTYGQFGAGNSVGVRGCLYQSGYVPGAGEHSGTSIPGAMAIGDRPVATWLEGNTVLVGWAVNTGTVGLSLCEPGEASQTVEHALGVVGTPLAIGIDSQRRAYLVVKAGSGVRISDGVNIDALADGELSFAGPAIAVDAAKPTLGALALLAATLGDNLVKAVATAPAVRDVGEGGSIEGMAQWLIGPLASGVAQLYGPLPEHAATELPEMTYEEGYYNPILRSGQLTYSLEGSTLTYSDSLPNDEWNPQAAYAGLWSGWPVINSLGIDAELVIPETPLFWRNLVQAAELP